MNYRSVVVALRLPGNTLRTAVLPLTFSAVQASPPARRSAVTEVLARAKTPDHVWLRAHLGTASNVEAGYDERALLAETIRIVTDKVSTKAVSKAIAANLQLVGMFADDDDTQMKGRIDLVDAGNDQVLRKLKIARHDASAYKAFGDRRKVHRAPSRSVAQAGITSPPDLTEGTSTVAVAGSASHAIAALLSSMSSD